MNRKLADIERYLRTWQGQIKTLAESDAEEPTLKLGDHMVDSLNALPLIEKIYTDIKTIVDGVKQ